LKYFIAPSIQFEKLHDALQPKVTKLETLHLKLTSASNSVRQSPNNVMWHNVNTITSHNLHCSMKAAKLNSQWNSYKST